MGMCSNVGFTGNIGNIDYSKKSLKMELEKKEKENTYSGVTINQEIIDLALDFSEQADVLNEMAYLSSNKKYSIEYVDGFISENFYFQTQSFSGILKSELVIVANRDYIISSKLPKEFLYYGVIREYLMHKGIRPVDSVKISIDHFINTGMSKDKLIKGLEETLFIGHYIKNVKNLRYAKIALR